jgi:hypothetical protein
MKAIFTKYLPCTDTKNSRIKAFAEGVGSVTIGYPHEFHGEKAHAQAALALARKIGWTGTLLGGGGPENFPGYVFVFEDSRSDRYVI